MKTQNHLPPSLVGHMQVALAMVIVGSSIAVGKIISAEMPVFLASFLRFAVAALFILPLNHMMTGRLQMPAKRERTLLGMQALFGVFLFSLCLIMGLKRTSAVNAGVILGMLPAVTALLSVLILRERLNLRYLTGISFSVLGAVLLESRSGQLGGFGNDSTGIIGMLLILGAVTCEALFGVIGKLAGVTLPAITITTWITLIGVALFAPFAAVEAWHFDFAAVSLNTWLLLLYYAVVVTVIGFSLFYLGLAKVSATAAGVHMAWAPLSAMLIAVMFLGEPFGLPDLLSAASVLAAVIIISLPDKRREVLQASGQSSTNT